MGWWGTWWGGGYQVPYRGGGYRGTDRVLARVPSLARVFCYLLCFPGPDPASAVALWATGWVLSADLTFLAVFSDLTMNPHLVSKK